MDSSWFVSDVGTDAAAGADGAVADGGGGGDGRVDGNGGGNGSIWGVEAVVISHNNAWSLSFLSLSVLSSLAAKGLRCTGVSAFGRCRNNLHLRAQARLGALAPGSVMVLK